jgi:hypothetical protein
MLHGPVFLVKHYSCDSVAELKNLWQVLPNATSTVAGYYTPGDKGGGNFMFIGVPDYANVVSAKPFDIAISKVTNTEGLLLSKRLVTDFGVLTKSLGRISRPSVA